MTLFGTRGNFQGPTVSPYVVFCEENRGTPNHTGGITGVFFSNGIRGLMIAEFGLGSSNWPIIPIIDRSSNGIIEKHKIVIRLNNAINLGIYNYLKITYRAISGVNHVHKVGVHTSSNNISYIASVSNPSASGVMILDVRNLSGNHFIYLETNFEYPNAGRDQISAFGKIELTSS